jgi:hypothetical protein
MKRFVAIIVLALLTAGCDSAQHPFASDQTKPVIPISALKDSASVKVAPIAGIAPVARDKLADAMADALQELDILATAEDSGGERLSLLGTARASGSGVAVDWRLLDSAGKSAGQATSTAPVSLETVNRGDPNALKTLAHASAAPVARLLQDDIPVEAPPQDYRHVVVRPVTGAPGDGTESLRLAMTSALTLAKLSVVPSSGDTATALAVVGTVKLDPPKGGKQHVSINWALLDVHGRQLGVVSQENDVRPGSLDGHWGEVANLVAGAAAPGIVALITKVEQAKPSS